MGSTIPTIEVLTRAKERHAELRQLVSLHDPADRIVSHADLDRDRFEFVDTAEFRCGCRPALGPSLGSRTHIDDDDMYLSFERSVPQRNAGSANFRWGSTTNSKKALKGSRLISTADLKDTGVAMQPESDGFVYSIVTSGFVALVLDGDTPSTRRDKVLKIWWHFSPATWISLPTFRAHRGV
jgi:hypothetical protein